MTICHTFLTHISQTSLSGGLLWVTVVLVVDKTGWFDPSVKWKHDIHREALLPIMKNKYTFTDQTLTLGPSV